MFSPSVGMVDVIFADVAQPDQTRIVALNAHNFLKNGGHFVISIKVHLSSHNAWNTNSSYGVCKLNVYKKRWLESCFSDVLN